MSHSDATSYTPLKKVETDPNEAAQTVQGLNMQGMNFIQRSQINNFQGAPQFLPRQSFQRFSNFGGNAPIYNFNIGLDNQISNITPHYGYQPPPPPYPAATFGAPVFFTRNAQGLNQPQQASSNTNIVAPQGTEGRSAQPSKKRSRNGDQVVTATEGAKAPKAPKDAKAGNATKAPDAPEAAKAAKAAKAVKGKTRKQPQDATGRPPQLKALPAPAQTVSNAFGNLPITIDAGNDYQATYQLPPYDGSVTISGPVPQPSPRTTRKSAVATRANDPSQIYGNQLKDYPVIEAAPPRNIDIGMLEICTFFPNWLLLPEVAMRAQVNGWARRFIVKAQLYATDNLRYTDGEEIGRAGNRVQKQYSGGGGAMFEFEGSWSRSIPQKAGWTGNQDLTANNWHFKPQWEGSNKQIKFEHISLKPVYTRVKKWPQGADRLILTKCMEFAFANQHLNLDTSHFSWIIQVLGLSKAAQLNDDHDRAALKRFNAQFP